MAIELEANSLKSFIGAHYKDAHRGPLSLMHPQSKGKPLPRLKRARIWAFKGLLCNPVNQKSALSQHRVYLLQGTSTTPFTGSTIMVGLSSP